MLKTAPAHDQAGWLAPALIVVGAITLLRVLGLWHTPLDLFVDEAQYWLWGRELAFGYYSKPPLIGWVIRLSTELSGSDSTFWVRLPGPLLHFGTSLVLGGIAARYFGRRAALAVAVSYATLPMVALASFLISTDTVMFLPLAVALAGYLRLAEGASPRMAALTGFALGLAFLAKYAAVYYLVCAGLAAVFIPGARIGRRHFAVVLAAFLATISPNLIWNALNGFTTLQHTLDNADWVRAPSERAGINISALAEFVAAQFGVFGPVLFGWLIWSTVRLPKLGPMQRILLAFSAPILLIVFVQALLSGAYANWAAAAYIAGCLLVVPALPRLLLWASIGVNGLLCALMLLAISLPERAAFQPLTARYKGRADLSVQILAAAETAGQNIIVAKDRDILADLFYTSRGQTQQIYSVPPSGRAKNHYAQSYALPTSAQGTALFVSDRPAPPDCAPQATPLQVIKPDAGAYKGKTKSLFVVPASCWAQN